MQTNRLGDTKLAGVPGPPELTRKLLIDADFIQLPLMKIGRPVEARLKRFVLEEDGQVRRVNHLDLASSEESPDYFYSYDVRGFRGRHVTLRFQSIDPGVLDRLELSDVEILDPDAYTGPHRPRFHFSPRRGWMNDINGPYYLEGWYHLFHQANPFATGDSTGFDMHWAHSVSKDLVHWEEWPIALFPDETGSCYSGSAVLVHRHFPGVNEKAPLPTPALFFTAAGSSCDQHLATTADGGRSWQRFPGNPVLSDLNRDPKVFWHEESGHYVMLLYMNAVGEEPEGYTIYSSQNLQDWDKVGLIPHWYECPEFLRMKSSQTGEEVWLLYGHWRKAPDRDSEGIDIFSAYQLGKFDGLSFRPISEVRPAHLGPQFYGALAFVNDPQNRPIMMGWARSTQFPDEPFNQCATVPLFMQLKVINGEDQLCFEPVEELNALRGKPLVVLRTGTAAEAETHLAILSRDLSLDVVVRFRAKGETPVCFTIRQCTFLFEPARNQLSQKDGDLTVSQTIIHPEGSVTVRFLIDRGIIESFWNHGQAATSMQSLHTESGPAFAIAGDLILEEMTIYPVSNIWASLDVLAH